MAEEKPDGLLGTITVSVTRTETVQADRADLFVTIRGASLFTGNMALSKAQEVARLVAELKTYGVPESDVALQGVRADTSSGVLTRTSGAVYDLKIHCPRLDTLADLLGIVTSQKNAELKRVAWGYPDDENADDRRLIACLARARQKAQLIADGLDVRLLSMSRFVEPGQHHVVYETGGLSVMESALSRRSRVTSEELGLAVSHSKEVTLTIQVDYWVSALTAAEPARPDAPETA